MHSALQGRARGVVAARERTIAFSSIFLKGGGKSAEMASLAHTALSYTPLWNGQALSWLQYLFDFENESNFYP